MKTRKKPILAMSGQDKARFYSKIRQGTPDECHEWTACLDSGGYGLFRVGAYDTMAKAPRVAYMLHHNIELPPRDAYAKTFVLHTCDNRKCCNPAHLYLGTNQDNMDDMNSKGRGVFVGNPPVLPGEANGRAILCEADVRWIRAFCATKANRSEAVRKQLSERFGISFNSIRDVIDGRSWRHIV